MTTVKKITFKPCLLEYFFLASGYELIHDGRILSEKEKGTVQFILPPEEIRYFVRKLQLVKNGRIEGRAWFEYDMRDFFLIDFGYAVIKANGVKEEQRMALGQDKVGG
jgi:hypothetical protein